MRLSKNEVIAALIAALVVLGVSLLPKQIADAATGPCIHERNTNVIPALSPGGLEAYFDVGRGDVVYRDTFDQVRQYRLCNQPTGWVQIDYSIFKGHGMRAAAILVIESCAQYPTPDTPVACDPQDVVLRGVPIG